MNERYKDIALALEKTNEQLEQVYCLLTCLREFCIEESYIPEDADAMQKKLIAESFTERIASRMPILGCAIDILENEQKAIEQLHDEALFVALAAEKGVEEKTNSEMAKQHTSCGNAEGKCIIEKHMRLTVKARKG